MKKTIAFGLLLLAIGLPASAEEASVMPKMVGRVYFVPLYGFIPGGYDADGAYKKADNTTSFFNLGMAVEFGVLDWLSAAIQWAPGWTPWSDAGSGSPFGNGKVNLNGVQDIFAGAKILILGKKALVENDTFRGSVALGVKIPLSGPDYPDEVTKALKGETATLASMDKHVFAAGARFYFDWIINEYFFLNLYNETMIYPVKQNLDKAGPTLAGAKVAAIASGAPAQYVNSTEGNINYKYMLTFEVEPHFAYPLAEGIRFTAGLPVTYKFSPAPDYSVTGPLASLNQNILARLNGDPAHSLSVGPNVSVFFTKFVVPIDVLAFYNIPVWGRNGNATHTIGLKVKVYFAVPGADR